MLHFHCLFGCSTTFASFTLGYLLRSLFGLCSLLFCNLGLLLCHCLGLGLLGLGYYLLLKLLVFEC